MELLKQGQLGEELGRPGQWLGCRHLQEVYLLTRNRTRGEERMSIVGF